MFDLVLFLALTDPALNFREVRAVTVARFATESECDAARWAWFADQKLVPFGLPPAPEGFVWIQHLPGACDSVPLVA